MRSPPDALDLALSEAENRKLTTIAVEPTPPVNPSVPKTRESISPRTAAKLPEQRTKGLVAKLLLATSPTSKLLRSTELCNHLLQYPEARSVAVKVRSINSSHVPTSMS